MKKTDKTALTAALFAAAMSAAAMGGQAEAVSIGSSDAEIALGKFSAVYGPPPDYYETDIPEPTTDDPFDIIPQPEYGPMWTVTTTTEAAPVETTTVPEMPTFAPVYGPPSMVGDLNGDGEVDTFDMIKMRRFVSGELDLKSGEDFFRANVNGDYDVNVADLISLGRYLIGRPVTFVRAGMSERLNADASDYSIVPVLDENGNRVYDPMEPIPQPAYGPPIDLIPEVEATTLSPEEMRPQPVYGPPEDLDPIIIEPETEPENNDDPVVEATTLSPEEMRPQPVYGPPNDYIEPIEEIPTYHIEEPTFQAVYGPPSFFGLEDK
jgi:hypothetical protein